MSQVIWLSVITVSVAFTITETKLFLPLREWVNGRSTFLGKLVNCGYCLGHWIAFALLVVNKPKIVEFYWLLDYFLTALAIAWLGAFQWILMCYFMKMAER